MVGETSETFIEMGGLVICVVEFSSIPLDSGRISGCTGIAISL